jgi:alpha-glucosidase
MFFMQERVISKMILTRFWGCVLPVFVCVSSPLLAQDKSQEARFVETPRGVQVETAGGTMNVEFMAPTLLHVDVRPHGKTSPRTEVISPSLQPSDLTRASIHMSATEATLQTPGMTVTIMRSAPWSIAVLDARGRSLVSQTDPLAEANSHRAEFHHPAEENLYGMRGLDRRDNGGGLLRNNGAPVAAGAQGDGGAPWFFTPRYGVLIDSDGGEFFTQDGTVDFNNCSRDDLEYFVIQGPPLQVMAGLSDLTGRPPMPPRWTLGFLNSQWGSDENEVKQIVSTYRAKHIPIDGFILDYDWKAQGEDNYGEWRWNSTSSPGNIAPDKFPDGASGLFAQQMRDQGIQLCAILKPRILVYKNGSTTEMDQAAAYADAHGFWYPDEPPLKGAPTIRDLDFANPETRAWFWKHLEPAFEAGMTAWWNDEADSTYPNWPDSRDIYSFNNFQFFNMGRMLYEGQRQHSDLRVWSINRNFYSGAQRYGYAEWSGDIETGFESMQDQRMRMLATLDLGEPHWSMDTGGFFSHPSAENYARWMEFAAFVPIDRVHGGFGEKRQPWIYGPKAEAAATRALRLRYSLLPYIYSSERRTAETGVGVVRPLFWIFPEEPEVANEGDAWMFGDALLVSPVVKRGESTHSFYLPAGIWFDYFRGSRIEGGQILSYTVDPNSWEDIPLFVRSGSIVATQPPEDYVDEHPVTEVTLDVFPAASPAQFVFYDDDGKTYSYEHGGYYRQQITALAKDGQVQLATEAPTGSLNTALRFYLVKIHGNAARAVLLNGKPLSSVPAVTDASPPGTWSTGKDRFGPYTVLRMEARTSSSVEVR